MAQRPAHEESREAADENRQAPALARGSLARSIDRAGLGMEGKRGPADRPGTFSDPAADRQQDRVGTGASPHPAYGRPQRRRPGNKARPERRSPLSERGDRPGL